jgi:hypothetical protein
MTSFMKHPPFFQMKMVINLSFEFISLRIKDLFAIFCVIYLTNSPFGYWFRQISQNFIENLP